MKAKRGMLVFLILGLGLVGFLGPGLAQSCSVTVYPGESIQSAIDSAWPGAVICLAEGSWQENLIITKDDLVLRGEGPSKTFVTGSIVIQVAGQFTVESLTFLAQPGPAPAGMALIPAGSFRMGDSFNEGFSDELPVHEAYVSAFYMDQHEVTKALWDEVASWAQANGYDIGPSGGSGKGPDHPVVYVSWYEAVKWANARSEKEGLTPCYTVGGNVYRTGQSTPDCTWTANGYRLPTEAEWEKAARGELVGARYPWGNDIDRTKANYGENVGSTTPVGSYAPNGYGLYDMAGNVWEWCWDWYDSGYYSRSPGSDPHGPGSGSNRVPRGGGWFNNAGFCRVAFRSYYSPGDVGNCLGFRLARTAP